MGAKFGAAAAFISDWRGPADVCAYARPEFLVAMSHVAEAHTSTKTVRFMLPSAIQFYGQFIMPI